MEIHLQELHPAGAPLYIVPEREIDGFDHFEPGVALGNTSPKTLDRLCHRLGVRPLSSFLSEDAEALQENLRYEGYAVPEMPALTWFDAADGLPTVRALAAHLTENPESLKNGPAIIEELGAYEIALERFAKEGIRWYISAGF